MVYKVQQYFPDCEFCFRYERPGDNVAHCKFTVLLLPSGTSRVTGLGLDYKAYKVCLCLHLCFRYQFSHCAQQVAASFTLMLVVVIFLYCMCSFLDRVTSNWMKRLKVP